MARAFRSHDSLHRSTASPQARTRARQDQSEIASTRTCTIDDHNMTLLRPKKIVGGQNVGPTAMAGPTGAVPPALYFHYVLYLVVLRCLTSIVCCIYSCLHHVMKQLFMLHLDQYLILW